MAGLTCNEWQKKLGDLGRELRSAGVTVNLVAFGSVPIILSGQPARTTIDLDVWNPESEFDRSHLAQAADAAGFLFDPKEHLEPEQVYLRIVDPGMVQLGGFQPRRLARFGGLLLQQPPPENLIANKLVRAEPQDIHDILWLAGHYRTSRNRVAEIVATFPHRQREAATENLVYLEGGDF